MPLPLPLRLAKPRWTLKGRVVYNRKTHVWGANDIRRIINYLFPPAQLTIYEKESWWHRICREISEALLGRMLAELGLANAAGYIVAWLEEMVYWITDQIFRTDYQHKKIFYLFMLRKMYADDYNLMCELLTYTGIELA